MIFALLLSFIVISSGIHEDSVIWNYEGSNGADFWADLFEPCRGTNQSPVNVICNEVMKADMDCFDFTDYKKIMPTVDIMNLNGRTIEGIPSKTIRLSGGELDGKYTLKQWHFHWGEDNDKGSEHTFDGMSYPLEAHFVHMNEKYSTLEEALENQDGIAVLAVFYEVGDYASPAIKLIANNLVHYANEEKTIYFNRPLIELLPKSNCEYFRYQGSLTTPNCNEAVTWTLFSCPSSITQELLDNFRKVLQSSRGHKKNLLRYNFRPTQPLNGRIIEGNGDCNC